MNRSILLVVFGLTLGIASAENTRPNILLLFTDDHATQAISAYGGMLADIAPTPHIDRLAREGMLFRKSYVTNSICGPSRAVTLTGKYSHLNGFRRNGDTFDGSQSTAPKLLRKAGYQTSMIGKWHLHSEPTGFDHYEVLKGQGQYYNPTLLTNGETIRHVGYTTDIIGDRTLEWLEQRDRDRPFFLMSQHKAPHGRWEPAARHLALFENEMIPEPPSLFDDYKGRSPAAGNHEMGIAEHMGAHRLMFEYSSKFNPEQRAVFDAFYGPKNRAFERAALSGKARTQWNYQRYIKNYLRCVRGVDENIGRILDYLDQTGLAENTLVIYSSDQGFYLGEHGWFDKRWMYEESLRTPLIVRWPGVVAHGVENDRDIVLNLDLAETFLDAARVEIPSDMQGRSLVPVLKGETPEDWRKYHYYHYYEAGGHGVPVHYGITDSRHKLIRFPDPQLDTWELYDLENDPQELTSIYEDPANESLVAMLKRELERLRREFQLVE